ncbi:tetraacyldisaccharide 4'-kinase [Colwellia sp. E2M01]|uniref:tetraacyldisaccharide 4'-kinase n=1 Tax=Colwellia sp. E2M01 TaxID=2841561 RepID=UPI001C0946F9|nr:tetraacyldisaccharide 4'-kinase [Colwellia sp. E2M01]MBU2870864.1 tetraacyldisaccharide 4'-kinase [Colwellia sp. E2M01]
MRLIEKVWFQGHKAKWLLIPLLLPLSFLFWLISKLRRIGFTIGLSKSVKLNKPVIVVGNIGVGGNGKTPVVIYLVELTRSLGLTPGVISRGYGGQAAHYPYLVTEHSTPVEAGDEPVLINKRCQVPVAVGSDRIASAELLISQGCDIIISDDGLQHYRLQRDLELIIVDGKRLFGNGLLLPAGPLREGKWRLSHCDLVIYNGKAEQNKLTQKPTISNKQANIASLHMSLTATQLCNLATQKKLSIVDFIKLHGKSDVNAIAGIGAPQRFFDTLNANKITIIKQKSFVDHHSFTVTDFSEFNDKTPLLMTEKDAVKCQAFCKNNWWYLPVDAEFSDIEKQMITDKINPLVIQNTPS